MAGSLALPLQIWKKQMILITKRIIAKIPNAIGTINVQQRTTAISAVRTSTTTNFNACLTWKEAYGELLQASNAIMIPIHPNK